MPPRRTKKQKSIELVAPLPEGIQASAEAKVGFTDVSRLAWLLELLNRSQESIAVGSEQERVDLEAQVVAFAKPVGMASGGHGSSLSLKDLKGLARDIRASILGMLQGASLTIDIPKLTFTSSTGSASVYIGHPNAIFRLAVAKLVETEKRRIKLCARPDCDRLFVRRKGGLFCSRQCSQIVQFKRYLARHAPH